MLLVHAEHPGVPHMPGESPPAEAYSSIVFILPTQSLRPMDSRTDLTPKKAVSQPILLIGTHFLRDAVSDECPSDG